jgi:hypothetical protein
MGESVHAIGTAAINRQDGSTTKRCSSGEDVRSEAFTPRWLISGLGNSRHPADILEMAKWTQSRLLHLVRAKASPVWSGWN